MIDIKEKLSTVSRRLMANLRYGRRKSHWAGWLPGIEITLPNGRETGEIRYFGKSVGATHPKPSSGWRRPQVPQPNLRRLRWSPQVF